MKHFGVYRKLILSAGTVIAAVSIGAVLFMESTFTTMLFVICAFAISVSYTHLTLPTILLV